MRIREGAREGWRDVVAGAGGAAMLALVFAVLVGTVVGLRAGAVASDIRAAHAFVAAGAATTVVQADSRIDGRACDALLDLPGVRAAGALRNIDDGTTPSALPRTAVPTYEVTAGFAALLSVTGQQAVGVIVSDQVADELGVHAGDDLPTAHGRTEVTGVYAYPDDGRDPALAYALLAPALDDDRPFDACWATAWPKDDTVAAAVRRVVAPPTGAEGEERVTSGQLNPRLGVTLVSGAGVLDAVTAPLLASGAGTAVGWAAIARRRLSLAADRHVGVPAGAQVVGMAVQHLLWSVVGALAASAGVVVLVRGLPAADAVPIVAGAVDPLVLGVIGTLVGGAIGLATIRERSLHRYFRTR